MFFKIKNVGSHRKSIVKKVYSEKKSIQRISHKQALQKKIFDKKKVMKDSVKRKERTLLETLIHLTWLFLLCGLCVLMFYGLSILFPSLDIYQRSPIKLIAVCSAILLVFSFIYYSIYKKSIFPILSDIRIDSVGYIIIICCIINLFNIRIE